MKPDDETLFWLMQGVVAELDRAEDAHLATVLRDSRRVYDALMERYQPPVFTIGMTVECPNHLGCGVDVSYFTANGSYGLVLSVHDGVVRVWWPGHGEVRHYEYELREPCDDCDGKGWKEMAASAIKELPAGAVPIQRCDMCHAYADDDAAAQAALAKYPGYHVEMVPIPGFESEQPVLVP